MGSMRFKSNAGKKYITHIVKKKIKAVNDIFKYMYLNLTGYKKAKSADVEEES